MIESASLPEYIDIIDIDEKRHDNDYLFMTETVDSENSLAENITIEDQYDMNNLSSSVSTIGLLDNIEIVDIQNGGQDSNYLSESSLQIEDNQVVTSVSDLIQNGGEDSS